MTQLDIINDAIIKEQDAKINLLRNRAIENLEPIDFVPYFKNIAGQWNGDDSGKGEDRAQIANEIIELLKELQTI